MSKATTPRRMPAVNPSTRGRRALALRANSPPTRVEPSASTAIAKARVTGHPSDPTSDVASRWEGNRGSAQYGGSPSPGTTAPGAGRDGSSRLRYHLSCSRRSRRSRATDRREDSVGARTSSIEVIRRSCQVPCLHLQETDKTLLAILDKDSLRLAARSA